MESFSRVMFLCRGSLRDGMGHVTRSRSVALEMTRHADVKFVVVGDSFTNNLLVDSGIDYQIVASVDEANQILNYFRPQVVFIDMLEMSENEFDALSSYSMTVSLSPIFNQQDNVDMVFSRTRLAYLERGVRTRGPQLHCGPEYAIISDH